MKRLILLISLVLFSFFSLIDNHKEQPYLANTDRILSLSCPDYLPTKVNNNETTLINKSDAASGNISNDWYSQAVKNIRQEEYNISYCEETGALQSPNRANNILFTYHNNGFTAKTMQTKIPLFDVNDRSLTDEDKKYKELDAWSVELKIKNYELGIISAEIASEGNKAWIENDNVRIDYTNTSDGMRQDFVIKEKPLHDLSLQIDVITKLKVSVNKNYVTFSSKDGTEQLKYSSLKAWDAEGKELAAYFEIQNSNRFAIRVDDREAVYPVTIDPLSSTPDWVKESNSTSAAFGISVSTAGDVNGDGYDDVIIGAHRFSGELVNQGKAYLFYGSAVGLNSEPAWTAVGTSEKRYFGWNVSNAGDINNDGFSDVLIVSSLDYPGEYTFGAIYAYYGSASGLSSVPDWTNFNYSEFTIAAGAGDINGDGYDDIILSRPKVGPHFMGIVYLYYGSASGLEINQAWSFIATSAGRGLSSAGDVNGDGYGDIIISAYYEPPIMGYTDKSILFLGSAEGFSQSPSWSKSNCYGESVSGGGDINGDGYDDVIIGDGRCSPGAVYIHYGSVGGISADADRTISGSDPNARFGSSVSNTGDINADGYSDIIIGARNDLDTGKAFVYYGSDSGPVENSVEVFQSDQINDQFGADVSSAGDVNNDGFSDVMIGAPSYSNGESGEGRVLVYYGSANLTPPVIINLSPHQNAIDVSKSSDITVAFGENMNSSTINNSNIKVYGSLSGYKNCFITYDAFQKKAIINPDIDFKTGEDISITLTSGIQSYSGISLIPFVYQFTAEATGGTGIFTEVSVIDSTLPYPTSITAGDVDQDGDIDLLIGKGSSIKIYKNNGEGFFSEFSEINEIGFIKPGDIDNDGDLDLIQSNEGILKTFLNDGNGIFTYHNSGYGSAGEFADFDGDGDIDIAYNGIYSLSSNLNIIIEKNNNGVFSVDTVYNITPCFSGYGFVSYLSLTDFNNDGRLDISEYEYAVDCPVLEHCFGCGYLKSLNNSPSGIFTDQTLFTSSFTWEPYAIFYKCLLLSFNKDNDNDVDYISPYFNLTNQGNEIFTLTDPAPGLDKFLLKGDYDGDGDIDIATERNISKNNGEGNFPENVHNDYFIGWDAVQPVTADLDNDGSLDLALVRYLSNGVSILLNDYKYIFTISGSSTINVGSVNNIYVSSSENGFWEISNYDSTQASIPPDSDNDTVLVSAGNKPGHFILYFIAHFDGFRDTLISKHVYVDNPYPVELTSFIASVSGRDVNLSWSTSAELNNAGFEIEKSNVKSQTSNEWSKVGFVSGSGTSTDIHNYEFTEKGLNSGKYNYRLKQIDFNGNFEYFDLAEDVMIGIPLKYYLSQNYPNPFNPVTNFDFEIPELGFVTLKIYDVMGRELLTLVNENKEPGYYTVRFDGSNLSSGVYFYRMTAGEFVAVKKFVLIK